MTLKNSYVCDGCLVLITTDYEKRETFTYASPKTDDRRIAFDFCESCSRRFFELYPNLTTLIFNHLNVYNTRGGLVEPIKR